MMSKSHAFENTQFSQKLKWSNKKPLFGFCLALLVTLFSQTVFATDVQNLKVLPNGNEITIEWDALDTDILNKTDGYALQWGENLSDIRNDKFAKQYLDKKQVFLNIRAGTFENDKFYYFRVYTWTKKDDRNRILTNGSQIIKWKIKFDKSTETESLTATNDVDLTGSSDITTSNGSAAVFGNINKKVFDLYAVLKWSKSNLAKSDYSGFLIEISDKEDFSNILKEIKTTPSVLSLKVKGLVPATSYYARGSFYKEIGGSDEKFGQGITKKFKTQKAFSIAQKQRVERLRKRGLLKDSAAMTVDLSDDSITSATPDEEDDSISDNATDTEIRDSIAKIEKQIRELQAKLLKLKAKLSNANAAVKKSNKLSLRERIKTILAKKRKSRISENY